MTRDDGHRTHPRIPAHMRVMTVPTTAVLDAEGNIRTWNRGLTHAQKLAEQFQAVLAAS